MKTRMVVCLLLILGCVDAKASLISDFSWIPSGPSSTASTTLSDGTVVTLETTPIPFDDFQFGSARVFSLHDPSSAVVTLTFSRDVKSLRLLIDDLDASVPETLSNFSVVPTYVDGFLTLNLGVVESLQDNRGGNLIWDALNASSVMFTFNRCAGCGLYLRELEITPVPSPASWWLFGWILIGLLSIEMRRFRISWGGMAGGQETRLEAQR